MELARKEVFRDSICSRQGGHCLASVQVQSSECAFCSCTVQARLNAAVLLKTEFCRSVLSFKRNSASPTCKLRGSLVRSVPVFRILLYAVPRFARLGCHLFLKRFFYWAGFGSDLLFCSDICCASRFEDETASSSSFACAGRDGGC